MILNQNLLFSDNQAITATAISANVLSFPANSIAPYETAAIARDLGSGTPIPMLIQVVEAFNTLTSLTITLETADNAALSTAPVVLGTSGAVPLASLIVGFRPFFRFMPAGTVKQFLGLRYTVTGTNPTLGRITAALATEVQSA